MGWTKNFGNPTGTLGKMIVSSMNKGHTPVSEWGLKHYQFKSNTSALDIGCGGGMNINRMLKWCTDGIICGIDISDESVKKTKEINKEYLGNRCFVDKGSAENLPYDNDKFDLVTAFETIYFWQDVPESFAEVKRVLKEGGTFMIVNEMNNPSTIWNRIVEGMNIPTEEQLNLYFKDAGFSDITIDVKKNWIMIQGRKL